MVVRVDGLPRPATVVERAGQDVLVRFRDAGGFTDRWLGEYANLYGDRILSFDNQEQSGYGGRSSHRSGIMHHK